MFTIGVDAHKSLLVAVLVDGSGRQVESWSGRNTTARWEVLRAWAERLAPARRWGIEGSGGYGAGLAQALAAAGETVYEVNPRLTAALRRRARRQDKNDRLDAVAVAQAVLREPKLPQVLVNDETAVAALLSRERAAVVAEATRLRSQLHALLHQLDPEYKQRFPDFERKGVLAALEQYGAAASNALQRARAAAVRRLAARLRLALAQRDELTREMEAFAQEHYAPLLEIPGVAAVLATGLAGELGTHGRFHSEAQLAAYAGVAPLEASSAGKVRHRLNRGGNRRLNAMAYWITLTQLRYHAPARAYLERRTAEGRTWREIVRALKRYVMRHSFLLWQRCGSQSAPALLT